MSEKYTPSSEELENAESSMTADQKRASIKRERVLEAMQTDQGSFAIIKAAEKISIPEKDIKLYALKFIGADIRRGLGHQIGLRIARSSGILTEKEVHDLARETYTHMLAENPADDEAAEYLFGKESQEHQWAMWLAYEKEHGHSVQESKPLDLKNINVVDDILVRADPAELMKLQAFYDLYPEEIEIYVAYAQLHHNTHFRMIKELTVRVQQNPEWTDEEKAMGTFKENLEPQVREAVLLMRKKGYPTYESGFDGPPFNNRQKVSFEDDCLADFNFPEDLIKIFSGKGIIIKKTNNSIILTFGNVLKMEELKEIWDQITQILPDRGHPAPPTKRPAAEKFREKQKNLK